MENKGVRINNIDGIGEWDVITLMERKIEWKDREDRKKNIVIRRVEIKKGDVRRGVEKIIRKLKIRNVRN